MPEGNIPSSLVQNIYDAALDRSLWPVALRQAGGFVGGSATSLYAKEVATKGIDVFHHDGAMNPECIHSYAGTYVKVDPSTTRHFFTSVGQSVSTADVMPYREFALTRFCEEWAKPNGLVDSLSAVLEKSGTRVSMFTVFRAQDDGMIDELARRRMRLVLPHIRRATLIAGIVDHSSASKRALADTVDLIAAGVFLLDRVGRVVHVNVAGRALLAAKDPVASVGGRLVASDPEAASLLSAATASLADGAAALGSKGIAVPIKGRDGELYVAHLLPLSSPAHEAGVPSSAVATLFVRPAARAGVAAPEALAKAYKLTPTELRVLLTLVEVGGGTEVADALGIASSTVRFHLKAVFEKTGVHRQTDLLRLVASFSQHQT